MTREEIAKSVCEYIKEQSSCLVNINVEHIFVGGIYQYDFGWYCFDILLLGETDRVYLRMPFGFYDNCVYYKDKIQKLVGDVLK